MCFDVLNFVFYGLIFRNKVEGTFVGGVVCVFVLSFVLYRLIFRNKVEDNKARTR